MDWGIIAQTAAEANKLTAQLAGLEGKQAQLLEAQAAVAAEVGLAQRCLDASHHQLQQVRKFCCTVGS